MYFSLFKVLGAHTAREGGTPLQIMCPKSHCQHQDQGCPSLNVVGICRQVPSGFQTQGCPVLILADDLQHQDEVVLGLECDTHSIYDAIQTGHKD